MLTSASKLKGRNNWRVQAELIRLSLASLAYFCSKRMELQSGAAEGANASWEKKLNGASDADSRTRRRDDQASRLLTADELA